MPVPGRAAGRKRGLTEQTFLRIPLLTPLLGRVQGTVLIKHLPYGKQYILLMLQILHK